ncbi:MAG: helicase [Rhodovulum sulfidophilum]|uniref:Helicase n=1 Tax=Rhodovulum sulfidophilum TaxID=35806 RepID=A0A2W5PWP5_RHOSU|nr:MAG: helicase [Rhodovulum sulfidophilum]
MTGIEGVPAALAAALGARGFTELTEVQAAILGLPDQTRDLIVSAATGSGKTVAIGLALAAGLLAAPWTIAPRALVLAPTRELAAQVAAELGWLYAGAGILPVLCAGGADPAAEVAALARGAALVVGTPGRLAAHLRRGTLDPAGLATLVLDEADELLARGFRDELDRILAAPPPDRRLLLFSATITPGVAALAARYQRAALRIEVAPAASPGVGFEAVQVAPAERDRVLGNLLCLADPRRALVFAGRRDAVAPLAAHLAGRGFRAVGLSGDLGQPERDAALAALRAGRARVCVATDLAARGLDLPELDLVIHADPPLSPEQLLHRSGRTGRAGRGGRVAFLVAPAHRRRLETLLRRAGLGVAWRGAPEAAEVAARERDRLLAALPPGQPGFAEAEAAFGTGPEAPDFDAPVLAALRAEGPDRLARALLRDWRAARPRFEPPRVPDPAAAVWFRVNRGAGGQEEVRRLLPLIRRLGGARREEIGRIRVFAGETHFEVLPAAVPGFLAALGRDLGDLALSRLGPEAAAPDVPSS